MGWDRNEARAAKAHAAQYVGQILAGRDVAAARRLGGAEIGTAPGLATVGVALGLTPQPDGGYGLAVRYRLGTPSARMVARRIADEIGPSVDVRRTGRVHRLARRVVPTARAAGETGRIRPLQPGISIAHVDVTAGTLGAFVQHSGAPHVLSNHHVLVGGSGEVGDAIVQPGPADGGAAPDDRIGTLATFVPLERGEPATVDAALATLADTGFESDYPGGALTGTVSADGGEAVSKIGRTTGLTQGVVTAIEIDGLLIDFGPEFGTLSFDGQIEVESTESGPFSQGGDSGSLVYTSEDVAALGLLFAGSDAGGSNGLGLTYLNPIDVVLERLGAELLTGGADNPDDGVDDEDDGPI